MEIPGRNQDLQLKKCRVCHNYVTRNHSNEECNRIIRRENDRNEIVSDSESIESA